MQQCQQLSMHQTLNSELESACNVTQQRVLFVQAIICQTDDGMLQQDSHHDTTKCFNDTCGTLHPVLQPT